MKLYLTISTVPPHFTDDGWCFMVAGESDTGPILQKMAERAVETWIEAYPKGEIEA